MIQREEDLQLELEQYEERISELSKAKSAVVEKIYLEVNGPPA